MSTASVVDICNLALGWLGANLITSIDENSTEAKLCKLNYERSRDATLEDREWTFAVERFILAPDATPPAFGWGQRFQIPSNVIRVLTVDRESVVSADELSYNLIAPEQAKWVREGEYIFADLDVIYVRALVRIEDITKFSEQFVHAFAARMATDLAVPLVRSRAMQEQMFALYRQKLDDAMATDGLQGRSRRIRSRNLMARR